MSKYPSFTFTTIGEKAKAIVDGVQTLTVLVIGSALDGPLNTPTRVANNQDCEAVFGPANYATGYLDPVTGVESGRPAGATIPLAVSEAFAGGCQDVYVMRVAGTKATATLGSGSYLAFKAKNPGRIYNGNTITYSFVGTTYTLAISQPLVKGGNITLTGSTTGSTLLDLLLQINNSGSNRLVNVDETATLIQTYLGTPLSALAPNLTGTATLTGGTNGCFAQGDDYGPEQFTMAGTGLFGYAQALVAEDTGTFDSILNNRFGPDVVVLTGVHLDDQLTNGAGATTTSIAVDFADYLAKASAEIQPVVGILGTRAFFGREDSEIINYIKNNLKATAPAYWDQNAKWIKAGPIMYLGSTTTGYNGTQDLFSNLIVCSGPPVVFNHKGMNGDYTANFGAAYAGFLSSLPPESSSVQQPIPGIKAYGKPWPYMHARTLLDGVGGSATVSGKGAYVCLVKSQISNSGPLVVNDDVTAADRNDFFANLRERMLVNSIHKDIKNKLAPHLGKSAGAERIALMEAAVLNILEGYNQSGALFGGRGVGFDYEVKMSGADTSAIIVRYEITPARTIRKINQVAIVRSQN
jgi:hypothetical protein